MFLGKFSDLKTLFYLDHEEKQKTQKFLTNKYVPEDIISTKIMLLYFEKFLKILF